MQHSYTINVLHYYGKTAHNLRIHTVDLNITLLLIYSVNIASF